MSAKGEPTARACLSGALPGVTRLFGIATRPVAIGQDAETLDTGEGCKIGEIVGVAKRPSRLQTRPAIFDARCRRRDRFQPFADDQGNAYGRVRPELIAAPCFLPSILRPSFSGLVEIAVEGAAGSLVATLRMSAMRQGNSPSPKRQVG